ncbi:MAG: hypothetical protein IJB47_00580 [Oscillospiraceae bacterium]|nr:hypothetical protein [Oscillospiraceae bacterium]
MNTHSWEAPKQIGIFKVIPEGRVAAFGILYPRKNQQKPEVKMKKCRKITFGSCKVMDFELT